MRKNCIKLMFLSIVALLFSCAEKEKPKLDIAHYFSLATSPESIYPSAEQIALLEEIVPKENYTPVPPITDRSYWDKIAASEEGKKQLEDARSKFDVEPEIPISDEIYRRANKEGNRGIYKPRYYNTMARLESYLLAECIENKGEYLPRIETYCNAILSMKSWLHPNHDDRDNGVLEGRRLHIDLSARKFGLLLSLVDVTLGDKLSPTLRKEIDQQLERRIMNCYLTSCKGENEDNNWIRKTNNWNSVCNSGVIFTFIVKNQDRAERIEAIGSMLNCMKYYVSGFGQDGYCSEGTGYWNYGFGHYLYIAEIIYDYTDGAIDLYKFDDPEKMKNVAFFPITYVVQNDMYTPFSDGVTSVSKGGDNYGYLASAKHYGTPKPDYFLPDEAVFTIIGWRDVPGYTVAATEKPELPAVTYFDDMGIVISRGDQSTPLSISIKAGHNAENHNHGDVGSYAIFLGNDIMSGDIGAPGYVAGAFDADHPVRGSWGHPVPYINSTIQPVGIERKGVVTKTDFTDGRDYVEIDLKAAYDEPALQTLTRTMTNDKSANGQITITDSFTSSEPITYASVITVCYDYKIEGNTLYIDSGDHKMKAEITANGGAFEIKDEPIAKAQNLRIRKDAYRISINYKEPIASGDVKVVYTPLN